MKKLPFFLRLGLLLAVSGANCFLAGCKGPSQIADFPPAKLPEPPERPKSNDSQDNSIQVGDSLEIFVREDNSFNGIYGVREMGDIIISQVGRIPVAGMSVAQAGRAIEAELEKSQLSEATIIVDRIKRAHSKESEAREGAELPKDPQIMVYITGKVNRPGQHRLTLPGGRPLGVYEAVMISGGLGRFAHEQKVYVVRTDDKGMKHRIPVNFRLIEQGKAPDPPIGEGDIVVVPEKVFGT